MTSIEELKFEGEGNSATGLRIALSDGAVDFLVHTLDEGPSFPEYRVVDTDIGNDYQPSAGLRGGCRR